MHIPATSITLFCTYQRDPNVLVVHLGGLLVGSPTRVLAMQGERGQKEISAARVREVEVQLATAQNSLKSERLLLQQASLATLSLPPKTYPSAPALTCLGANLALKLSVTRRRQNISLHLPPSGCADCQFPGHTW